MCVHDWLGLATPLYANVTSPLFNRVLPRHLCVLPSLPPSALSRQPFDTVFALEWVLLPPYRCFFPSHAGVCVHRLSRSVLFCVFLSPPHLYVKTKYTNTHIDIRIYFYAQEHQKR